MNLPLKTLQLLTKYMDFSCTCISPIHVSINGWVMLMVRAGALTEAVLANWSGHQAFSVCDLCALTTIKQTCAYSLQE